MNEPDEVFISSHCFALKFFLNKIKSLIYTLAIEFITSRFYCLKMICDFIHRIQNN